MMDIIEDKAKFGLMIPTRHLLETKELPFEPAARAAGLSVQTLLRWEKDASSVKLVEVVAFARYLDMSLEGLLELCEVNERKVTKWLTRKKSR